MKWSIVSAIVYFNISDQYLLSVSPKVYIIFYSKRFLLHCQQVEFGFEQFRQTRLNVHGCFNIQIFLSRNALTPQLSDALNRYEMVKPTLPNLPSFVRQKFMSQVSSQSSNLSVGLSHEYELLCVVWRVNSGQRTTVWLSLVYLFIQSLKLK